MLLPSLGELLIEMILIQLQLLRSVLIDNLLNQFSCLEHAYGRGIAQFIFFLALDSFLFFSGYLF
jgi:hypothetical protein